ncbi:MAG: hypothetical protein F9K46_09570 [Anaerolineae bacterium]|nr:MAG: hypothetical protein F9K46_09570 [Anaerolineae bacterium]
MKINQARILMILTIFMPLSLVSCSLLNNLDDEVSSAFCTKNNSTYQMIDLQKDEWLDYFANTDEKSFYLEDSNTIVIYDHPFVEGDAFVVVIADSWPSHPLGSRGFIYALHVRPDIIGRDYKLEHLSEEIYCYYQ